MRGRTLVVLAGLCLLPAALTGCSSTSSASTASGGTSSASTASSGTSSGGTSSDSTSPGSPSAKGHATTKDPCVLITAADATAATGVTQPVTKSQDTGVTTVCQYQPQGVPYSKMIKVSAIVPDDTEPTQTQFTSQHGSDHSAKPVSGVGAVAYWNDSTVTLSLWQDGQTLDIQVSNSYYGWTHAQSKSVAVRLAQVAVARM